MLAFFSALQLLWKPLCFTTERRVLGSLVCKAAWTLALTFHCKNSCLWSLEAWHLRAVQCGILKTRHFASELASFKPPIMKDSFDHLWPFWLLAAMGLHKANPYRVRVIEILQQAGWGCCKALELQTLPSIAAGAASPEAPAPARATWHGRRGRHGKAWEEMNSIWKNCLAEELAQGLIWKVEWWRHFTQKPQWIDRRWHAGSVVEAAEEEELRFPLSQNQNQVCRVDCRKQKGK